MDGPGDQILADPALALAALAMALEVVDEPDLRATLESHGRFVAQNLVDLDGAVRRGFTKGVGLDGSFPELELQATVIHGLFEAWRMTRLQVLHDAAVRAGRFLLEQFFDGGRDLPRSGLVGDHLTYTPRSVGMVLAALRLLNDEGGMTQPPLDAGDAHDRLAAKLFRGPMVLSEWDENGEVLGDGDPDTNKNGIKEVALAGGKFGFGVAPVLASRVVAGPDPLPLPPGPVSWSQQVQPMLRLACGQCHLNGARLGEYSLETHQSAFLPGESRWAGAMIAPGAPAASLLFQKVDRRNPPVGVQMPQALPPLNSRARALLEQWIEQGARNN
jgi:hypothetical protein